MKKLAVGLTVLTLLVVGAIAYAHSPEWNSGGHGYGYHMTDPGYGGHMMGWTGHYYGKSKRIKAATHHSEDT